MLFVFQLLAKSLSGLLTHQPAVAKASQITSERTHSSQPIPQQPQPAIISEKSGSESIEEVLLVEDEGFSSHFFCIFFLTIPSSHVLLCK